MDFSTLGRFSTGGFADLAPEQFPEAASFCFEWSINHFDVRYQVIAGCFELSYKFWSEGEGGVCAQVDSDLLEAAWKERLPSIIDASDVEEGTTLATALLDEIRVLAAGKFPF